MHVEREDIMVQINVWNAVSKVGLVTASLGFLINSLTAAVIAAPSGEIMNSEAEALYAKTCAACHDGPIINAPHRINFTMYGPDTILHAMTEGLMKAQSISLTDKQKIQLAEHLGERKLSTNTASKVLNCEANAKQSSPSSTAKVSAWGITPNNARFINQQTAALTKAQIPNLKLKWSFAYPNATRARSQPTVRNGVVYVGSQDGTVYALDMQSGCAKWSYKADAEVRSAIVVAAEESKEKGSLFFGDFQGNIVALDASSGERKWRTRLDDHPDLTITGTPKLHKGIIYVPLSSREWATAADPGYACCTFRGGVVALNANDGTRVWASYTTDEPTPTGEKNEFGKARIGPSGAPVWNSPTIDEKRNRLYIGTGENYSSPASDTSDAVIAMDLTTGKKVWSYQSIADDAWNMACFVGGGTNCPAENGPDFDIGASTILLTLSNGKDIVLAGQKSGHVFALDPDKSGKLLWKKKIGLGGFLGGVHWGMAANNDTLYAPIADTSFGEGKDDQRHPGLHSIDAKTGDVNWYTRAKDRCKPEDKAICDSGFSAAVTATPEVVFAGALDGYLMALDRQNGKVIWEYATDAEFTTVSGEAANGGSIESDGPVIVDGHVLVNSGYSFGSRIPGNVLLVFSVNGK